MTTLTWTAAASGLWTSAANWSPAQVPATGDAVLVTLPGPYLISEPGSVAIDSLVLVDGMLIPVRFLLNQATIVQRTVERIRYWYVELSRHAILLAEG